jgi:hypothetical protein
VLLITVVAGAAEEVEAVAATATAGLGIDVEVVAEAVAEVVFEEEEEEHSSEMAEESTHGSVSVNMPSLPMSRYPVYGWIPDSAVGARSLLLAIPLILL